MSSTPSTAPTETPRSQPEGASLEPLLHQWCKTLLAMVRENQIIEEARIDANEGLLGPLVARRDAQDRMAAAAAQETEVIRQLRTLMIARCIAETWPATFPTSGGYPGRGEDDLTEYRDYLSDERVAGRYPAVLAITDDLIRELLALRAVRLTGDRLAALVAACFEPHGTTVLWKAPAGRRAALFAALGEHDLALQALPVVRQEDFQNLDMTTEEIITGMVGDREIPQPYHPLPSGLDWDWVARTWDSAKWADGAAPPCADCERPLANIHEAIRIHYEGRTSYWHRGCAEARFQTNPEDDDRLFGGRTVAEVLAREQPITEAPVPAEDPQEGA